MHFINCSSSTGPDKDFLYKELLHVNKNSQDFSCILCGKVFSLKSRLSLHIMLVHKHFKRPQNCKHVCLKSKYRCHLCNKGFQKLDVIRYHVIAHLKNHKCTYLMCDKQFSSRKHLNRHMRTVHLKTKEYRCVGCDKQFTQRSSLNRHMKLPVHLKIKDYKCEKCHKRFTYSSDLHHHMKTIHERPKTKRSAASTMTK